MKMRLRLPNCKITKTSQRVMTPEHKRAEQAARTHTFHPRFSLTFEKMTGGQEEKVMERRQRGGREGRSPIPLLTSLTSQ